MPRIPLVLLLGATAWLCAAGDSFESSVIKAEKRMQGRMGVFAMRGSRTLRHRANERFAYCSTFKWVLGAVILKHVDEGQLKLDRMVSYTEKDLLSHSPVTREHLHEGGMCVGDLCAATIATSDNAAANLLEALVGGPPGLQAFVRDLGDSTMRFDRMELDLNSNLPGDPRDTTSAEAMTRLLRKVFETEALSTASCAHLMAWMKSTTTGVNRIPAALPSGWTLAHKTGTSANGAVNDVAVLLPPKGEPIYLAIFTDGHRTSDEAHEAAIADVARLVIKNLS
jgi:beta-lactamase class A